MVCPLVSESTIPCIGTDDTMTGMYSKSKLATFKLELESGGDAVRDLVQSASGDSWGRDDGGIGRHEERADFPSAGYRSGYYKRFLTMRVSRIELCLPQDRNGAFSTELFELYERL